MNKKPFNSLNDYFVRYFFTDKGGEKVLLDFINAVMISANMKTFKSVEILNPFNLKKNYSDKETIVDVKCIISINLLNFNLNKKDSNVHSCYMIYDTKNKRLLTDHLQIHIIELKKFNFKNNNLSKDLNYWLGFFTTKDMEAYMSDIVKEKPIMEEAHKRYNNFIRSRLMMSEYEKKEIYQYDKQIMLKDERREGIKEGIKKGKLEGIKERNYSIAKNLKKAGSDIEFISEITGLTIEEINKL
ncbi:MAG: Rpn family recombination-promoting nuclease/putative transposase [Brachyspira sp.]|nr:Rpn family recombination-promoting nuclease/putative transposase [Brachyspira sp.]